jgi:phenylalanyl-tRNA synthetase alpha chain
MARRQCSLSMGRFSWRTSFRNSPTNSALPYAHSSVRQCGERWIEVLECGEIHPWLLNDSNLPSQRWSGLAKGVGLDRLIMLIKQIDDIRLLRSSDPRIARQMLTLARYEAVSNQPATHRDLSICVGDPDMR